MSRRIKLWAIFRGVLLTIYNLQIHRITSTFSSQLELSVPISGQWHQICAHDSGAWMRGAKQYSPFLYTAEKGRKWSQNNLNTIITSYSSAISSRIPCNLCIAVQWLQLIFLFFLLFTSICICEQKYRLSPKWLLIAMFYFQIHIIKKRFLLKKKSVQ